MNILTAHEFMDQGTSAAAILSIAKFLNSDRYDHVPQHALAARIRQVAEEVAAMTGIRLYALPRKRRPQNSNKRRHRGFSSARRDAA